MALGGNGYKWIWAGAALVVVSVGVFMFMPSDDPVRGPATGMSAVAPAKQSSDTPRRDDQNKTSPAQNGSIGTAQLKQLPPGTDGTTATPPRPAGGKIERLAPKASIAAAGGQTTRQEAGSGAGKTEPSFQNKATEPGAGTKIGSPAIDYSRLNRDKSLQALMKKRKKQLGIDGGVDIIARLDESIKIGDQVIPMKEIIDEIRMQQGEVLEKSLSSSESGPAGEPGTSPEIYGIHVVQPGENIWNIHFNLLRNYFSHQGVPLTPMADEPVGGGRSSGVGKLLKFSENIVSIYNIRTRKVASDLHMIVPLTKIVIYNMERIFALLDRIDHEKLDRIQFDGVTVWIPS